MKKTYLIILALIAIAVFGVARELTDKDTPSEKACTMEAKLCPDGSYVSRTGPNCEFEKGGETPPPPPPSTNCTKDSECPSSKYICQETQGIGTACPSTDPSCVPTHTIIKGECKLKEGSRCSTDSDCAAGNLCNRNVCTSPAGRECSGPNDKSCPTNFECVEGCGPPVVRYPDDTPPKYFCQLKGYVRPCPICLAKNTLIDTPFGRTPVENMEKGTWVWTLDRTGKRALGIVIDESRTAVPRDHKMVRLILDDGRELLVSPGHPTADRRTVGDLVGGNLYDDARILSSSLVPYDNDSTYDILPSGETGFYFANGILLGSTVHRE